MSGGMGDGYALCSGAVRWRIKPHDFSLAIGCPNRKPRLDVAAHLSSAATCPARSMPIATACACSLCAASMIDWQIIDSTDLPSQPATNTRGIFNSAGVMFFRSVCDSRSDLKSSIAQADAERAQQFDALADE